MKSRKQIVTLCVCFVLQMAGAQVWAAPQDQAKKPSYSLSAFNAYNAAFNEKDAQSRIKLLDDLLQKYPSTELQDLLPFIYPAYYTDYLTLRNYPQALAYVDKMLALGDQITALDRLKALETRAAPYAQPVSDKALQTPDAYNRARDAAAKGLETLDQWQKPANMSDDNFRKAKASLGVLFDAAAGVADTNLKDYKGAETSFRAALAIDPDNALTHYRLANAYLADTPQQPVDGFWEISRAIALKIPSTDAVKAYLRSQILNYQQLSCDSLVDSEVDELITLAGTSNERPATLTIPSADELQKAREDTANFLPWLQEGGQHGRVMWLATCGLDYPDVGVKVIEVVPGDGDNVTLKVYRPSAMDADAMVKEMEAATTPNFEVQVTGQPDAKKLMKDDQVRFTGTLTAYVQSPFLMTWDKAKINPEDVPPDKPAPGTTRRRPLPAKK